MSGPKIGSGSGSADRGPLSLSLPAAPATDYGFLADALVREDAAGFVAVGDRCDADVRYLARPDGPRLSSSAADASVAFVCASGADGGVADPALVVPAGFDRRAVRDFPGRVVAAAGGESPGARAASVLAEAAGAGRVLVPRTVPHDAAVYLERAGFDPASTRAVADARASKTDAELARLRFASAAAERGMGRVAAVLAAADGDADGGELRGADAPLTPERLRREANAAMAHAGADAAGDTAVVVGPPGEPCDPDAPLRAGETVSVSVSPRGPGGYRSALDRTFVVAGGGGWERRAHVAVTAAARAGAAEVAPGAPARRVREEVVAELAAHGFDAGVGDADGDGDLFGSPGGGVGLSRREAPSLGGDAELEPGHVLVVGAGLADPDGGAVRVADVVAVTADGRESLTSFPSSLSPTSASG